MDHINLIHENCEAFNGKDALISENAHEVTGTLIAHIQKKNDQHHVSGGGGGGGGAGAWGDTVYGSEGGAAAMNAPVNAPLNVCAACGERTDGIGALVSCEACSAPHHAMCVSAGGAPWMCLACEWANN